MKMSRYPVYLFLLVLVLASCASPEKETVLTPADPVPLEDFFKDPEKGQFRISPDGESVIFLGPYKGRKNVFLQKLGDTTAIPLTSETERSIYDAFWESDDRIIFVKDKGGDENMHILSVKPDGSGLTDHTPFDKVRSEVLDILEDRPDEMLIQSNKRDAQVFDVYLLNTKTNDLTLVAENPGTITEWVTDHAGKIRAAISTDGVNSSLLFRETEKDSFSTVLTTSFKETLQPYIFTFDDKNLYCGSNLGRDKIALVEFDPRQGKETRVLYEHPEVDIDGIDYSRKRKTLTLVNYQVDKPEKHYLDDTMKEIEKKIQARIPEYSFSITRKNREEDKLLVYTFSDRYFGGYYFYDVPGDVLTKLADFKPWLEEGNMAEMTPVQYTSRDGLTIHGYLTVPKGIQAKNLPTVINPHGGPWARDGWGFNPEVQFLANRGYAVLQMNYRGSTGYGREFWERSFKQWGRTMQDDISDGVGWLTKEGITDSTLVAIYGGSYGGYATLAGVTLTPDLYACAVDYVGVANMFTFMKTIPPYWEPYRKMFYEMVGDPRKDSVMLAEVSPVLHVDKIKCPLLIAQGANDPRVNKAESDQMVAALRTRGLPVEYIVKENEGHGFYNQENQFEFYGAMETFFKKYLTKTIPEKDM